MNERPNCTKAPTLVMIHFFFFGSLPSVFVCISFSYWNCLFCSYAHTFYGTNHKNTHSHEYTNSKTSRIEHKHQKTIATKKRSTRCHIRYYGNIASILRQNIFETAKKHCDIICKYKITNNSRQQHQHQHQKAGEK